MYHLEAWLSEDLLGVTVEINLVERRGQYLDRRLAHSYHHINTGERHQAVVVELVRYFQLIADTMSTYVPSVVAGALDETSKD